jgi:hypothetical protein
MFYCLYRDITRMPVVGVNIADLDNISGGEMAEIGKNGWLINGSALNEEKELQPTMDNKPERLPLKTVMVYWLDRENLRKEPLGILTERRKSERDNNNAIGMLRLARKEFAETEEQAERILIGEYV